jgi:hypothetical protein
MAELGLLLRASGRLGTRKENAKMNPVQCVLPRLCRDVVPGLALSWVAALSTAQTTIFEEPLSPRTANYDIVVTLDDEAKRIDGAMVLTWNNPSDDYVEDLQFHLYANAFKNAKSSLQRELLRGGASGASGSEPSEPEWAADDGWGWIKITRMEVDGAGVTDRMRFFQPDDENTDDETVIRVPLVQPIAPRASARIGIEFESKIPRCHLRTGWWQDDFFMMVHWFPKIGVYETPGTRFVPDDARHGRWNCHQFHAATEFYADFGVYDVQITLPAKYVVGTTGQLLEQRSNGDATKTIIAHAEDVHEFALVADAQFREATDVWRSSETGQEVQIRLLYQPDHQNVVSKYLETTRQTLAYVDRWLGPGVYPYPNLTVVDPRKGSGAGGMEYPTLFTGGASWAAEQLFGNGLRIVESVTIHEFLHQIWYGIVATNEFEEAWLDEGFTTYTQDRIMAELYGERTSLIEWWGASVGAVDGRRIAYCTSRRKNDGAIAEPTYGHWRGSVAFGLSYNKAGVMFKTLENYLGRERFDHIMRTYYQRWRFRHPCRDDFIATANEVAGENLDWFFDQVIKQATVLDYAVASVANVPVDAFEEGIFDENTESAGEENEVGGDAEEPVAEGEGEERPYECTVVFRRIGDTVFPMETLIEFSDGEVVRDTWDGHGRVKTYRFTRPARVIRAAIDPDHRVPLDVDRLNNSLRIQQHQLVTNKYTLKGFFWMQSLLQFFSILG